MNVSRVSVQTGAPSGTTNTYLLGSDSALLVDPAARNDALDAAIAEHNVDHIGVTHHHPDHIGAVHEYAVETGATVWAKHGRERSFKSATGIAPDRTFRGGTAIEIGSERIHVLEIPGHTPEHVGFVGGDGEQTRLLVGDLAVATGSVAVGAPEGDMRAYLGSLRRVYARAPDVLDPGHGSVITDPRTTIRELIDRRLDREQHVLTAIESGASTVSEITNAAYEKDISSVRPLAEATVKAHIEKLAVEQKVKWDGARASFDSTREDGLFSVEEKNQYGR